MLCFGSMVVDEEEKKSVEIERRRLLAEERNKQEREEVQNFPFLFFGLALASFVLFCLVWANLS